jgi:5'-3' exonuclease
VDFQTDRSASIHNGSEEGTVPVLAGQYRLVPRYRSASDIQQLLGFLGAWVVQSPGEGEALCALLNRLGVADAVAADDGDVIAFGAKTIVRNIGSRSNREDKMRIYDMARILMLIDVTPDQIVDICTLVILFSSRPLTR